MKKARLTLTLWYMLISGLLLAVFTVAAISAELLSFKRIELALDNPVERPHLTEVLNNGLANMGGDFRRRLLLMDIFLFVLASGGAYILSGLTLKPIEAMLKDQEAFAGEASHQLRTPLTVIKTELMAYQKLHPTIPKDVKRTIESVLEEVERMKRLTVSLLTLVRPVDQVETLFDSVAATQEAIQRIRLADVQTSLRIVWKPVEQKAFVHGRKDDLIQVVEILADNALKYTKGKVVVSITRQNREVALTVQDEGKGIAVADLKQIFNRFYRGVHSGVAGTGLGLAIAQKLIQNLGGSIGVSSVMHKGSTFWVRLPAVS